MSRPQANGVLPITASQTQTTSSGTNTSSKKSSGPRLKVVIRRLPPGLTEAEFTRILGEQWALGQGKVDWFSYKPGKDSKDLSKPSRPTRAYIHLTNESYLINLADTVRQLNFEDDLNTYNNSCLLGPPIVEFAPYSRVPSGRRRTDARQGTIDQDPEFMDFLESLANPTTTKETVEESADANLLKDEKVMITPLVQYLKDKKANKLKEAAANKASKQGGKSSTKSSKDASSSTEDVKKGAKETKKERLVEKATREAVKVLNRQAAEKTAATNATQTPEAPKTPKARERGSIAAAARILQRDLGLSPGNAHRKAKADAQIAAKAAVESQSAAAPAPGTPTAPKTSQTGQSKGRGNKASATNNNAGENDKSHTASKDSSQTSSANPITLLKKSTEQTQAQTSSTTPPTAPGKSSQSPARKVQASAAPSPGATKAFVKHANPSQGITEPLLKEAMEAFGAVAHVEIDKRKGFAYVDFVDAEGLVKAMAANPTKVAQGTVQVLERKEAKPTREPPSAPAGRGGGGASSGRGGRGGSSGRRGGRGTPRGGGSGPEAGSSTASAAQSPISIPTGPAADVTK